MVVVVEYSNMDTDNWNMKLWMYIGISRLILYIGDSESLN